MYCLILYSGILQAKDFRVTGRVTDVSGNAISGATVLMNSGTRKFSAVSGSDGYYSLNIMGIYSSVSGLLEPGTPYPNPFSYVVHIPFTISLQGDVRFSIYSMTGRKISELNFRDVEAGSYNINWDGCGNNRSPAPAGLYIYAVTFRGETWSGKVIRTFSPVSSYSGTTLEQTDKPAASGSTGSMVKVKVATTVSQKHFYPVRLTDITVSRDTVIDFELAPVQSMPFRTMTSHIARMTPSGYKKMILKGINLGSSPPGTFPGEIAYAINADTYEKWINRMGEAGFNCIRVYTLHPPVFYEKLANYNYRHRDKPIFLFQGIWLGEVEDGANRNEYDLIRRKQDFITEIREVTDCMHGNRNIALRPGRSYGNYLTDVSEWVAGLVLGREISPQEVDSTNKFNPELSSFNGFEFSINAGSASEVFSAQMLDEAVKFEQDTYSTHRPVSFSSWPTLDPLEHPTEIYTDEDNASVDFARIDFRPDMAGLFVTFHAYPYYPNFISEQPSYLSSTDNEGRNSYFGYLKDLKKHFSDMPLVIGEFGVPSSWGSAHWSYSNMEHGGYSEIQQGEKNVRLMNNIIDAGCAGGFMFAWMDEWFKPTWIVQYLEAFGFGTGNNIIPTRQLWHNITSPEQNFGLLAFDQVSALPLISYSGDLSAGPVNKASATHDNSFFHIDVEMKHDIKPGDTVMIAFDTYSSSTGESVLPNGKRVPGRSEFVLVYVAGDDTAMHHVTQAYDMNGLTPRFNLSDLSVQKFKSTVSDGAPWKLMQWTNDGYAGTVSKTGLLPAERSADFTAGKRSAVAWAGKRMKVRIPWTMLHFYDPTQMLVIDGATSYNGGWSFVITPRKSDGISVSVCVNREIFSATSRYTWDTWLVVPETVAREKKSLHLVETGLSLIPDLIN